MGTRDVERARVPNPIGITGSQNLPRIGKEIRNICGFWSRRVGKFWSFGSVNLRKGIVNLTQEENKNRDSDKMNRRSSYGQLTIASIQTAFSHTANLDFITAR